MARESTAPPPSTYLEGAGEPPPETGSFRSLGPAEPLRRSGSASWFLNGDQLQAVLDDPAKVAAHLARALPADARAAIIAFAEFGLTGSVTLNFHEGKAQACEARSHHRLGAA